MNETKAKAANQREDHANAKPPILVLASLYLSRLLPYPFPLSSSGGDGAGDADADAGSSAAAEACNKGAQEAEAEAAGSSGAPEDGDAGGEKASAKCVGVAQAAASVECWNQTARDSLTHRDSCTVVAWRNVQTRQIGESRRTGSYVASQTDGCWAKPYPSCYTNWQEFVIFASVLMEN